MLLEKFIQQYGTQNSFSSGQHIFMQGDENSSLYYIKEGLLKAYYITGDGKELIKSFLFPGDIIGSMTAVHGKDVCSFNLLCMRPVAVLSIPFDILSQRAASDLALSQEVINLLINFSMKKERREFELLCLSAEERYMLLLQKHPEIFDDVTQNDIARYLGITPVALSRIKKRTQNNME